MRIQYLPSTVGDAPPSMYLTTYLVNEELAIDAGVLGYWRTTEEQARVTDVVITHFPPRSCRVASHFFE